MFKRSRNINTERFDAIAFGQRNTAHVLSLGRVAGATIAAEYIVHNTDYRTAAFAAAVGVVAGASDFFDGWLARRAAKRLAFPRPEPISTTEFGKYVDQLSDKAGSHIVIGAIAAHEIAQGNTTYGLAMAAIDVPILARDLWVTKLRLTAGEGIETKAGWSGKVKAAIGMVAVTAAVSPLADSTIGEAGIAAGMTYFAYSSIKSGLDIRDSIANQQQLTTLPPPPEIMPAGEAA